MQFWDTSATRWSLPFPQATHDPTHKSTWYTSTKSWWLCQKQKTYLESLEEMKVVVCLSNYEDVCLVQDEKLWALSACFGADVLVTLSSLFSGYLRHVTWEIFARVSSVRHGVEMWTARQRHTSELDSLGSLEDNHENGYLRWDIIRVSRSWIARHIAREDTPMATLDCAALETYYAPTANVTWRYLTSIMSRVGVE